MYISQVTKKNQCCCIKIYKYKYGFEQSKNGLGSLVALAIESKGHEVFGCDINKDVGNIIKNKKSL